MAQMATLEGVPILWDQTLRWRLKIGVAPHVEIYEFPRAAGEGILEHARNREPLTLRLDDVEVRGLFAIGSVPVTHPDRVGVLVADQRWLWPYVHIGPYRFNVRRRSGDKRWLDGEMVDIQQIVDEYEYAIWSTNQGVTWTAWEALEAIATDIRRKTSGSWAWTLGLPPESLRDRQLPVDGLLVDTSGDSALAKMLAYTGGGSIYIDLNGNVQFVDLVDGSEAQYVPGASLAGGSATVVEAPILGQAPGPIIWDTQIAVIPDRRNVKPLRVDVLFTCEYEVRHDYRETGPESATAVLGEDLRRLDMVCQVTDPVLDVDGQEVAYSTWITFTQAFAAWQAAGYISPISGLPISHEVVQRLYAFGQLGIYYGGGFGAATPTPELIRIVGTIYQNYGLTYRIRRHWMDRVLSWRAIRSAILDPATGERARSQVLADYAVQYPFCQIAKSPSDYDHLTENLVGYADRIEDARPAHARVSIVDADLGILHVAYLDRQWGGVSTIYPRRVVDSLRPKMEVDGLDTLSEGDIQLEASHDLAVIVSMTPASPQGDGSLYRVSVYPSEATEELRRDLGVCEGPVLEIRIDPQLATARFAWSDDMANQIEQAFGLHGGFGPGTELDALLVDRGHLVSVARAAAAQEYARRLDKGEGTLTMSGHLGGLAPTGNMGSVDWAIATGGQRSTTLGFRTIDPRIDEGAFLSEATQRKLGLVLGDLQR